MFLLAAAPLTVPDCNGTIAPILERRGANCPGKGESPPMPLETSGQVRATGR